jgi:hypothetical protein
VFRIGPHEAAIRGETTMMNTAFRTIRATLATAAIGAAILATPAFAGGSFAVSYTPTDPDQAQALGLGLAFLSLANGMSASGGNVSQNGFGNLAGIAQSGFGNNGVIMQEGNGHQGTIAQNGNHNSCGLFQFGHNTNASCTQNGNGNSSATMVFGW